MPPETLVNVNFPAGEPTGIEVTRARQTPLQRRAEAGRRGRRDGQAPLRDLRVRALVQGRGGDRPLGGGAGQGLGHPDPLRPHRPRGAGAAAGDRLRGDARLDGMSAADACQACGRAARGAGAAQPPTTTSSTNPRSATTRYDELLDELRAIEAEQPRAPHPRLPDPEGRGAAARPLRAGRARRADALARQRPQRGGAAGLGDAAPQPPETPRHRAPRSSATRPSRRSTASRSRSPTRTASSSAARPAATAGSART